MGNTFIYISLSLLLVFASFVMILLVLIQRGRGGGLAGAFGGMGGQSAFGTRAGDIFTKITVGVAVVWVLSAGLLGISMRDRAEAMATGAMSGMSDGANVPTDEESTDGAETKAADDESEPLVEPKDGATANDAEASESEESTDTGSTAPVEASEDAAAETADDSTPESTGSDIEADDDSSSDDSGSSN